MAKNSIIALTGDGVTTQWTVNFTGGYMDESHVTCQVNGEVDGSQQPVYRALTFISPGLIEVGGGAAGVGEEVLFRRITPIADPVNDFEGGAQFSAANVDLSFQQILFGAQEAADNLADQVDIEITLAQVTALRNEAEGFKNEADAAQTAAETAQGLSEAARDTSVAQVALATTQATNAANSATAAAASEVDAGNHQTAAETARTGAETARTGAETAQTAAETAQTAAETAATNAQASETAAAASAVAAAASEANVIAIQDAIDDTYLGPKATEPTVDNDGDPLTMGDWYFNTTDSQVYIYNGTSFQAVAPDLAGDTTPQLGGNLDAQSYDITNVGKLGVGTSTASSKVHIVLPDNDGNVGAWDQNTVAFGQTGSAGAALGFAYSSTNESAYMMALEPGVAWKTMGYRALDHRFYYNGTAEGARLNSSGKLIVGATAVVGNETFRVNGSGRFTTDASSVSLYWAGSMRDIGGGGNAYLDFNTGGSAGNVIFRNGSGFAEHMRIDSSGLVNIGTSTSISGFGLNIENGFMRVANDATQGLELGYSSGGNVAFMQGYNRGTSAFIDTSFSGLNLKFNTGSAASEAMHIDSSGNVGIGQTPTVYSNQTTLGIEGTTYGRIDLFSSATRRASFYATAGSTTINSAGELRFDAGNVEATRILSGGAQVWGGTTEGASASVSINPTGYLWARRVNAPSAYFDRTNADGQVIELRRDGSSVGHLSVDASRIRIDSNGRSFYFANGNFFVGADNLLDLGSASFRWDDVYATNGVIQTSDRNEKQDIEELSEAETRVAQACKGLLRKFRWIASVEEKGDNARIHFGIMAQDLRDAFTAEGLDAGDYAMFISTTWYEDEDGVSYDVQNDEGTLTERTRLGVRYPELLAFIVATL